VALSVCLLGVPEVCRDAEVVPSPRGHKPWGLLAYLLLVDAPVSRTALCSLFFGEAADPKAALRWNLAALRQLVGDRLSLSADPVVLQLGEDDVVDVLAQPPRDWSGELLEGMSFASAPTFELWLETQRARLRGVQLQDLHESALRALAAGQPAAAVVDAGRLVTLAPYDEAHHALLVRSLAAAGDGVAAARRVAACRELFRRDLGVEPGPELEAAAAAVTGRPVAPPRAGAMGLRAQVEAGEAAIAAGAVDAGLHCLRRAVHDADGDAASSARALLALGSALVHAVRGRDEEGVTALHRAVALAQPHSPAVAAAASVELGYVEFLRGHLDAVEPWLRRAEALGTTDPSVRARVETVRGCALSDAGRYGAALEALQRALAASEDGRRRAYAQSMIGRVHLLAGQLGEARAALEASLDGALRSAWRSFTPWPDSLLAEVDLLEDRLDQAAARLDTAFTTSCELGDPCWEGVSGRGRGRVLARAGRLDEGLETLLDARRRSQRVPDGYRWVDAWTLEALCRHLPDRPRGHAHAVQLTDLASSTGMQHLLELGMRHRARWGESACLAFADSLTTVLPPSDAQPGPAPGAA
jgi:DNA-binding SARP family transcriptional activator